MRGNLIRVLGVLALAGLSPQPAPGAEPAAGPTAFACDLYRQLGAADGNLFFSPLSIHTALTMTWAGAAGPTADEMAAVLHLQGPAAAVHAASGALLDGLTSSENDPWQLALANRLWPATGLDLKPGFLDLTEKYYHARPQELDFAGATEEARLTINSWAEDNTQGMIKDLLHRQDLSAATLMVLTNAVYFQAAWSRAFDAAQTTVQPFHLTDGSVSEAPFMTQQGTFPYLHTDGTQVLQLPYAGSGLAFVAILPDDAADLAQLETELTPATLDQWLQGLTAHDVTVLLPRFEMTWRAGLREPLQELGMKEAFTGAADFSALTPARIFIDQVIHQARLQVTEEGTEAAAATAVVMRKGMRTVFRADHPFLFLIRDTRSGAVLFMGRLADPAT